MEKKKTVTDIGKALLLSVLVTVLFLVVFALLMLRAGVGSGLVSRLMIAGYILAPAAGGFMLGKKKKEKRYLWGILIGAVYFAVYFLISVTTQNTVPMDLLWTAVPMLLGGMAGGMLS